MVAGSAWCWWHFASTCFIAVFKFVAAGIKRVHAMLAEAVHSAGRYGEPSLPAHRDEAAARARPMPAILWLRHRDVFWVFIVAGSIFLITGAGQHLGRQRKAVAHPARSAHRPRQHQIRR